MLTFINGYFYYHEVIREDIMTKPVLTPELVITLQQLKGIGDKSVLQIGNNIRTPIAELREIHQRLLSMKGKKFAAISAEDLRVANERARQILEQSQNEGIGVITFYDDSYPEMLRHCKDEQGKDAVPLVLYYRGDLNVLARLAIAVIGTREPTDNGSKAAEFFAAEFAKKGFNIVSGLAVGCDAWGHKGALQAGGITTAFLGNGLDWESIYPQENLKLAQEIVAHGGLLLSEYPIGQRCNRYSLVARDRLQAGLAKATIVIQTNVKGGTMHAVNATIASGKPLFAVEYRLPVDTEHEKVQGNIKLIRDRGAHALTSDRIDEALSVITGQQAISHSKTSTTSPNITV